MTYEYNGDLKEPEIKSLVEAIGYAENPQNFAQDLGYDELALSISKTMICFTI